MVRSGIKTQEWWTEGGLDSIVRLNNVQHHTNVRAAMVTRLSLVMVMMLTACACLLAGSPKNFKLICWIKLQFF